MLVVVFQEPIELMFTFSLTSDELGDTFGGVDLNHFAMHQKVNNSESHFTIRPPQPGVYNLVIYTKVVPTIARSRGQVTGPKVQWSKTNSNTTQKRGDGSRKGRGRREGGRRTGEGIKERRRQPRLRWKNVK
jgi:hypothetical protein